MEPRISKNRLGIWDYTEIIISAEYGGNPFKEVDFYGIFRCDETRKKVPGFYDGDNRWVIRFMPDLIGSWEFETFSSWDELTGICGKIQCLEADADVHGPVRVARDTHFAYADGMPYYPVGTTCYVWNLQEGALEDKTLETLESSPFNKIRFCVYPKRYTFNHNEPQQYPFPGEVKQEWNPSDQDDYSPKPRGYWDTDYFNPEYFRHLDECVLALREKGIEADLILFHPYDFGAWGFDCLPEEVNRRILSYLVARLGAFRNIWWSFANEYDLFQNKAIHEWDRYIRQVQDLDPWDHLRSIHNCRGFYDHGKPWITHCSIQSDRFDLIPEWQETYGKPIVIDECGYEGDIDRDWGNLSGKEMVHRFWWGYAQGAYVGHGETYMHSRDVLWWSKGGELHGESPERIRFLRRIRESIPPEGAFLFSRENAFMSGKGAAVGFGVYPEYGLYYFGRHQPSFRLLELPESGSWEIEVIDTWEMSITSLGKNFCGSVRIELPGRERMALRIKRTG